MSSNTHQGTSQFQNENDANQASTSQTDNAVIHDALGTDGLSPIESKINSLTTRIASLEEQLASDGCNVADVEFQLTALQEELMSHLNGIEPAAEQEALAQEVSDSPISPIADVVAEAQLSADDGTLHGGIVDDVLENTEQAEEKTEEETLADNIADDLANIEPAAGEDTGSGSSDSSDSNGFGFQSTFAAGPIDALEDVGPIDPTQLEYGIEFQNEEVRPEEDEDSSIREEDDNPLIIKPAAMDLDESNLSLNQGGSLEVDFGDDGAGTITSNGVYNVFGSTKNVLLTSNDVEVVITQTNTGYEGTANGNTVFTLTVDPQTGEYVYNQTLPFDHANTTDPNDVITLEFGVQISDSDGDTDATTITINVADDAPTEIDPGYARVDESDLVSNAIATGTIHADFGNDLDGAISGNGQTVLNGLQSNSHDVVVTYDANNGSYTGTANGETIFTLNIQSNGEYTFELIGTVDHTDINDPNDLVYLQFGVQATDSDGDSINDFLTIKIADDSPIANDDINVFGTQDITATGNVISGLNVGDNAADTLSADQDNTVSRISFGGNTVDIPADGTASIDGEYGALEIASDGSYTYNLFDTYTSETTYSFSVENPPGSDKAGDIQNVSTSYNKDTHEFSFSVKIEDTAQGFTVALNDGANPKGHGGEMALFYFDASGAEPVVSVYAYNGMNTQTSWLDGGQEAGTQAADKITTSLATDNPFTSISVTTDADGNKIMSFSVDGTSIINHDPAYGPEGEWSGLSFDEAVGIWLHPASGLETAYDSDGYLTQWEVEAQSWYDTSYQETEVHVSGHECALLDPEKSDVEGTQNSLTKDGITVSVANDGDYDLTWVDTHDGSGLGIDNLNGSDSAKVWPKGETFDISFAEHASEVVLTIAEIGDNNDDGYHGVDYTITFADGSTATGEQQFAPDQIENGYLSFTISADDFDASYIQSIALNSTNEGDYKGASFLLNNVEVNCPKDIQDVFEYTLVDGDGDSSTATLTITGEITEYKTEEYSKVEEPPSKDEPDQDDVVIEAKEKEPINLKEEWEEAAAPKDTDQDKTEVETKEEKPATEDDLDTDYELPIYNETDTDTLYGGAESNIVDADDPGEHFICEAVSLGVDVIRDFGANEDDVLDFSTLIQNYDPAQQAIDSFVFAREIDGGTILSIDVSGSGDASKAVDLVALEGFKDVDLQAMVESGNINVM